MTNSLSKDSHITQSLLHSQFYSGSPAKNKKVRQQYSNVTVNNSIGTSVKKPAEIYFNGLPSPKSKFNFYTSEKVKEFLSLAAQNQVVFSASFALLLTCLLRPASIMALPSEKKNKDDKKYAAAQSVASGIIGFIASSIVANPISAAVKKISKNPKQFGVKSLAVLTPNTNGVVSNYFNKVPDILMSVPKGIITVALIPVILKYVFGWEKKNKNHDKNDLHLNQNIVESKQVKKEAA